MEEFGWVMVDKPNERELWEPHNYVTTTKTDNERPLKVEFKVPAQHWTDAIPIGNGRLGAMIWGSVQSETLNLNEDTLWTGTPGDYSNPEAPKALAEVRKLVDNGQFSEATTEAVKLSDNPSDVYQPLGDIRLEFDDSHSSFSEQSYWRELDIDTATARVKYSVGNIEFIREHFASYPDQVIVTKISSSLPSSLSFTVYLDSKLHHSSRVNNLGGKYQIIMEGSCPGRRTPPKLKGPKGIQYCTTLELQISGNLASVTVLDERKLRVEGSDWVVLKTVASSSFDGPFTKPSESKKDPSSECVQNLNKIEKYSYDDLYARHLDDYQSLFHRVSLELSKSTKSRGQNGNLESGDVARVSTGERVKSFQENEDPSLIELLFQYGRYLLISSSRPGTQVSNLQGIWSQKIEPAWE